MFMFFWVNVCLCFFESMCLYVFESMCDGNLAVQLCIVPATSDCFPESKPHKLRY